MGREVSGVPWGRDACSVGAGTARVHPAPVDQASGTLAQVSLLSPMASTPALIRLAVSRLRLSRPTIVRRFPPGDPPDGEVSEIMCLRESVGHVMEVNEDQIGNIAFLVILDLLVVQELPVAVVVMGDNAKRLVPRHDLARRVDTDVG